MRARLGLLALAALLLSGCVAIPPLVTVHKDANSFDESGLRKRVDELERRVRDLEANSPRK